MKIKINFIQFARKLLDRNSAYAVDYVITHHNPINNAYLNNHGSKQK